METRISIIGSAGIPNRYGGFETLAENLVIRLNNTYSFTVYCSTFFYKREERQEVWNNAIRKFVPLPSNGLFSILYDCYCIIHASGKSDILLILGVSGTIILPLIRLFTGKKIIVHIDGVEWKREKWNVIARPFLYFSTKIAFIFSHDIISDNKEIINMCRLPLKKIHIIEYGGDHTKIYEKHRIQGIPEKFFLTVARIEPENNIHAILKAFHGNRENNIVIIGNWNNSAYGKKLKKQFCESINIFMLDPIYDQALLNKIRSQAYCYIHGHSAGGTNPSLVEAMWMKLPVISFDSVFNRNSTENSALYFSNSGELQKIITTIDIDDLKNTGEKLHKIAKRRYTWKSIIDDYIKILTLS